MDYFTKVDTKPSTNLGWNIPEQKQGSVNVIGGNSQRFNAEIKISEYLSTKYPIKNLNVVFPDALKTKLPPLPNFIFLSSTDSGSFADGDDLIETMNSADFNLLLGDLSKNTVTGQAIASACTSSDRPLLITRDAVDLMAEHITDLTLMNDNLILLASMPQLIKLFRAVYYPKMLVLSQSLIQVADALHKFTLSYPVSIITLHSGQILLAQNGSVRAIALEKSGYTPLGFWHGELATDILALNLYNPNNFLKATTEAIYR